MIDYVIIFSFTSLGCSSDIIVAFQPSGWDQNYVGITLNIVNLVVFLIELHVMYTRSGLYLYSNKDGWQLLCRKWMAAVQYNGLWLFSDSGMRCQNLTKYLTLSLS